MDAATFLRGHEGHGLYKEHISMTRVAFMSYVKEKNVIGEDSKGRCYKVFIWLTPQRFN